MALVNPPEWKMEKRTFVPWTKPTLVVDIATSNFNFVKEFGAVIGQYKNILDMGQEEILVVIVNVSFHCLVLKCDSSMALKVRLWPMTRGALLVLPPQLLLVRFSLPKHKTGAQEAT